MKIQIGNMWDAYDSADYFCITTNGVITPEGLVMGAGIAQQAAERFPEARKLFATAITTHKKVNKPHRGQIILDYGFIPLTTSVLAAFQVKLDWRDPADLGLIKRSAEQLAEWATAKPGRTFHLNYPGIGRGRLPEGMVEPLLECLPDNVTVWKYVRGA